MIDERDRRETYCRRLGHAVPFGYCRSESDGKPCRLILDCWWQVFDVETALRDSLAPAEFEALRAGVPPPNKVLSIFDLIQQAKNRVSESPADEPPPPGDDTNPTPAQTQ